MSIWKIEPKKCERLHPQLTFSCDSLLKKLGARGFEPRTSALSELRSNQLSYAPLASQSNAVKLPSIETLARLMPQLWNAPSMGAAKI
jgi:hypothetical protein